MSVIWIDPLKLQAASGGTPATWDAANKGSSAVLSSSDRTLTVTAPNQTTRATGAKSTGKWYAEVTVTTGGSGSCIGVGNASVALGNYPAGDANGWIYYGNGQKSNNGSFAGYGNSYTTSDIVQIAWDADNGKLFFGKNGTWQASGDPAAGTNAAYTGLSGALMLIGGSASSSAVVFTGNWGQSAFTYSPPSGFAAWTA